MWSGGMQQHVFDRLRVFIPLGAVAPVLFRQFVGTIGIDLARLEAAELLLLGDLQPELADHGAEGILVLLELVDLAISAAPLALMAEVLHALDQDASIVAAIENGNMTSAWQVLPETPEIVMRLFLTFGRGVSVHGEAARVEHLGHTL